MSPTSYDRLVSRLVEIHKMLDPPGTSLKSTEDLIAELQAENARLQEIVSANVA